MNEEQAIVDAFAGYEEEESNEEIKVEEVEEVEKTPEPEYSALELEARKDGHTTKDEWIAAGKDPERWKSAHEFVEYGKIKGALDKSKADQDKLRDDYDKRFETFKLGVLLKQARIEAGMTQEQIAQQLQTTKSVISRMENHADDIRLSTLEKFAKAIGKEIQVVLF